MSGGHFEYAQYKIDDIAESIKEYLEDNEYEFSEETIKEFENAIIILKKAYIYSQRIDWLLSGDDGEDSFHTRLKEDLDNVGD